MNPSVPYQWPSFSLSTPAARGDQSQMEHHTRTLKDRKLVIQTDIIHVHVHVWYVRRLGILIFVCESEWGLYSVHVWSDISYKHLGKDEQTFILWFGKITCQLGYPANMCSLFLCA